MESFSRDVQLFDFEAEPFLDFQSPSPPVAQEERRRRAEEARKAQILQWERREQELERDGALGGAGVRGRRGRKEGGGKNVSFQLGDRLRDAVMRSDQSEVERLLHQAVSSGQKTPDVNITSRASGISLLHLCCVNEDIKGVRVLLEWGANVNIQDNDLWTPLHVAAACGSKDIVELLLQYNADCTKLDVDGNFPNDNTEDKDVQLLLLKHMKLRGVYEHDLVAIRSAQAREVLAGVNECIASKGDLNRLNKNGASFLHIAAANGYNQIAKLLLNSGADINIIDDLGYTPLHLAAKFNQVGMVKLLLKRRASPKVLSYQQELAIDLAEKDEILKYLEFVGGGKKLHKIPSTFISHPQFCPVSPSLFSSDPFGPPSPDPKRKCFVPGRGRMYTIDMGEFARARERSKPKVLRTADKYLSKLEQIYESNTLLEVDTFDEGVDPATQAPVLRKLHGNLKQRRMSVKLELPDPQQTDNLATMSELTEEIVLESLEERYSEDQIYTYIGEILIALNPFKPLHFYTTLVSREYSSNPPDPSLPPHIYAVANQVYRDMMNEARSQCCVISGESGAGKTETCKLLVQQLLFLSESKDMELNIKIEQVNPILETFGNAQTVMNDNSSRFGKYLELIFSDEGAILGAKFKDYLLEKLRVVTQASTERNFHVFYMMFAGLSEEEKKTLCLLDPASHRCLTGSGARLEGMITELMGAQFQEVRDSLRAIGFSEQDECNLLQALAAILHTCDITFDPQDEGCVVTAPTKVELVANLLQVNQEELLTCLTTETMYTRGEAIVRRRTLVQAGDNRDALAKAVYGRMFSWIVNGINHHLQPEDSSVNLPLRIGLLDIFGFESFERNSFEQMCINVANEQLQHYFNRHIFQWEQEECAREGVSLASVSYTCNFSTLEIFLDRTEGLLAILDEESRFPKATDVSLALKLHKTIGDSSKGSGIYVAPPNRGTSFGVLHYAGYVEYDMIGFLDKNRDTLSPTVASLMRSSDSLLIREIFGVGLTRTGSIAASRRQTRPREEESPYSHYSMKTSRRMTNMRQSNTGTSHRRGATTRRPAPTVANHFKNSLTELMKKMDSSKPHFIRCVKPNRSKRPLTYDPGYVRSQLKYTGVMETTRIRRCGYPTRLSFEEFLRRYKTLREVHTWSRRGLSPAETCSAILDSVGVEGWAKGKTKVMLKFNHPPKLEAQSVAINTAVMMIQKCFRGWQARKLKKTLLRVRAKQNQAINSVLSRAAENIINCHQQLQRLCKIDAEKFREKLEKQKKVVASFLSTAAEQAERSCRSQRDLHQADISRFKREREERESVAIFLSTVTVKSASCSASLEELNKVDTDRFIDKLQAETLRNFLSLSTIFSDYESENSDSEEKVMSKLQLRKKRDNGKVQIHQTPSSSQQGWKEEQHLVYENLDKISSALANAKISQSSIDGAARPEGYILLTSPPPAAQQDEEPSQIYENLSSSEQAPVPPPRSESRHSSNHTSNKHAQGHSSNSKHNRAPLMKIRSRPSLDPDDDIIMTTPYPKPLTNHVISEEGDYEDLDEVEEIYEDTAGIKQVSAEDIDEVYDTSANVQLGLERATQQAKENHVSPSHTGPQNHVPFDSNMDPDSDVYNEVDSSMMQPPPPRSHASMNPTNQMRGRWQKSPTLVGAVEDSDVYNEVDSSMMQPPPPRSRLTNQVRGKGQRSPPVVAAEEDSDIYNEVDASMMQPPLPKSHPSAHLTNRMSPNLIEADSDIYNEVDASMMQPPPPRTRSTVRPSNQRDELVRKPSMEPLDEESEDLHSPIPPEDDIYDDTALLSFQSSTFGSQGSLNGINISVYPSAPPERQDQSRISVHFTGNSPMDCEDYDDTTPATYPRSPPLGQGGRPRSRSRSTSPHQIQVPPHSPTSPGRSGRRSSSPRSPSPLLSAAYGSEQSLASDIVSPPGHSRLSSTSSDVFVPEAPPQNHIYVNTRSANNSHFSVPRQSRRRSAMKSKAKSTSSVSSYFPPPSHRKGSTPQIEITQHTKLAPKVSAPHIGLGSSSPQPNRRHAPVVKQASAPSPGSQPPVSILNMPLPPLPVATGQNKDDDIYDYADNTERIEVPGPSRFGPLPYTPPIRRKSQEQLLADGVTESSQEGVASSTLADDDWISTRPPAPPPANLPSKERRPPALPPTTLSRDRPPAPLPPGASSVPQPQPQSSHGRSRSPAKEPNPHSRSTVTSSQVMGARNVHSSPPHAPVGRQGSPPSPPRSRHARNPSNTSSSAQQHPGNAPPVAPPTSSIPPPPAPPPPHGGVPKRPTPTQQEKQKQQDSPVPNTAAKKPPLASSTSVASGIGNVQLRKVSDRPLPDQQSSPQGGLLAEMNALRLRKRQNHNSVDLLSETDAPHNPALQHVKLRPASSLPPASSGEQDAPPPPVHPRLRRAPPPKPARPSVVGNGSVAGSTGSSSGGGGDGGVPEWKRELQKRKTKLGAVQSVDVGSAGQYEVPQWKRELMENRARAKQLQEQRLT